MKKLFIISFLFSALYCYASAGSANDEIFFLLAIIAVMLFIMMVLYTIDFFRKIVREHKEKKILQNFETDSKD